MTRESGAQGTADTVSLSAAAIQHAIADALPQVRQLLASLQAES
jgi:hypothetical protein